MTNLLVIIGAKVRAIVAAVFAKISSALKIIAGALRRVFDHMLNMAKLLDRCSD
jgi:hypothetical protein